MLGAMEDMLDATGVGVSGAKRGVLGTMVGCVPGATGNVCAGCQGVCPCHPRWRASSRRSAEGE